MRETAQYYLDSIRSKLDLPSTTKRDVLRELASHYVDIEEELTKAGLQPSEIYMEVTKRMGDPADIAARLNTAHNTASWKSALMCALPFVGSAAFLSISELRARTALTIILLALFSAASIREFVGNRRSVWLAPWLAGAFGCFLYLAERATGAQLEVLRSHEPTPGWTVRVVACFILATLTLIAVRNIRPWRNAMLACIGLISIGGTYLFVTGENSNVLVFVAVALALIAVLIYFARGIFEMHRYGSPTLASLFLLTWFTRRFGPADAGIESLPLIATTLLCGAVVIWLARTPLRKRKTNAIWLATYVWSLGNTLDGWKPSLPLPAYLQPLDILITALLGMIPVYLLVFLPLWSEDRARQDRPAISQ